LPEMAERLNHCATDSPGWCHVPRRRIPEHDFLPTYSYPSGAAVREENDFRGHLIGQAEQVRGIGARGLQPGCVTCGQSSGYLYRIWRKAAKGGVFLRVVVETTTQSTDDSFAHLSEQGDADGFGAPKVTKGLRSETPTPSFAIYSTNYFFINT